MTNLTPDKTQTVGALSKDIEEGCAFADALTIESQDQYAYADKVLSLIATKEKEVEAKRKAVTGPINQALKEVNSWFKPVGIRLTQAKNGLKHKMLAYRAEVDRKTKEAAKVAAEAAQAGRFDIVQQQAAAMTVAPSAVNTTVRKTWNFRVDNLAALPVEYHLPNEREIRRAMRSMVDRGQTPELPGVTFYQEEGLAVR